MASFPFICPSSDVQGWNFVKSCKNLLLYFINTKQIVTCIYFIINCTCKQTNSARSNKESRKNWVTQDCGATIFLKQPSQMRHKLYEGWIYICLNIKVARGKPFSSSYILEFSIQLQLIVKSHSRNFSYKLFLSYVT